MRRKHEVWANRLVGILLIWAFPWVMWVDKASVSKTRASWKAEFWEK